MYSVVPFRLSCDSYVLRETLSPNPPVMIGQLKPQERQIPRSGTPLFRVVFYYQPPTGNFQVLAESTSRRPEPSFRYLKPIPPAMKTCLHHLAPVAIVFTVVAFSPPLVEERCEIPLRDRPRFAQVGLTRLSAAISRQKPPRPIGACAAHVRYREVWGCMFRSISPRHWTKP